MEQFKSILVDVDAMAAVHPELERAVKLARRCGASLTIADSTTVSAHSPRELPADIDEDVAVTRRRELVRLARRAAGVPTTTRLLIGSSATVLIEEVVRSNHDLLVRSHARDVIAGGSTRHGAVDEDLLIKSPCSVLLVGPGRTPEHPRIAGTVRTRSEHAVDDALSKKVIELTLLMTRLEDGLPILLQTWVPFAEGMIRTNALDDGFTAYVEAVRQRTAGDLAFLARSFGGSLPRVLTMSRRGEPEDVIPEFAVNEGIDLVVMAAPTNEGGISEMLFGRPSQKLLQRLTCSLLTVRL